jgi:hypothetical protein
MSRPLMQLRVGDLEAMFARSKTDVKVLKQLEHELQYRQVPRAVALLAEVQAATYSAGPAAPAPEPPKSAPRPSPQQPGLWERPATPLTGPVAAPIAAPPPAEPIKAHSPPAAPKTLQAAQPTMLVEDAYKLLKTTAGSNWQSIEQTRRQLVLHSHPARLKLMSPERRLQALEDAKRVNAAYMALSRARCER